MLNDTRITQADIEALAGLRNQIDGVLRGPVRNSDTTSTLRARRRALDKVLPLMAKAIEDAG